VSAAAGRFIDTSMLVRYFTDDIPEQAAVAESIIESERSLLVNSVILMECGYVLTRVYSYSRVDVADVLVQFLRRANVQTVDVPKDDAVAALLRCRDRLRVSFGDALIVAAMLTHGSMEIYSFDKRFEGPGIRVLPDE
jgi:predicted nucleic acid-binding protein